MINLLCIKLDIEIPILEIDEEMRQQIEGQFESLYSVFYDIFYENGFKADIAISQIS
jgi:hypothetical protein